MHWNTVNIAKPKLSKLVMPSLGPAQYLRHVEFSGQENPFPQG